MGESVFYSLLENFAILGCFLFTGMVFCAWEAYLTQQMFDSDDNPISKGLGYPSTSIEDLREILDVWCKWYSSLDHLVLQEWSYSVDYPDRRIKDYFIITLNFTKFDNDGERTKCASQEAFISKVQAFVAPHLFDTLRLLVGSLRGELL